MRLRKFTRPFFPASTPSSWAACNLGSVVVDSQYGLNEPATDNGSVPIVGMKDIVDGVIDTSSLSKIVGKVSDLADYILKENDILINRTNSYELVGKTAIFQGAVSCVYASYLVRLTVDKERVDPHFLNFWMGHSIAQRAMKRIATRAVGQANLNPTELKKLCPMLLPPLDEQKRIVSVLSACTRAMSDVADLMENNQKQRHALIQQLLWGKTRFPKFQSGEFQLTKYGKIPQDWSFPAIGTFAKEVSARNPQSEDLPVLACSKYVGFVKSLEYFKKQVFSDDTSTYKVVPRGTFGFPANHIEEGSIGYQNICDAGLVSPIYCLFRTNGTVCDGYVYRLFKTDHYRQIFSAATSSSVDRRGSLRWSEFSKLRIPLPTLEEQQAISRVFDAVDAKAANLSKQHENLTAQRDALMQQLLTGKRRVKAKDIASPIVVNG